MPEEPLIIWKPRDEWRYVVICHRGICTADNNGSGLCQRHYGRWLSRRRFWQRVKALFIKPVEAKPSGPDQKKTPTELGIYD